MTPFGEKSTTRSLGEVYIKAFSEAHPDVEVRVRDLSTDPLPYVDGEAIRAGTVPEDARPSTQQAKHQLRLDLIKELTEAKEIVITTPMWNWSIPAVLKSYIDQIVLVGHLDPYVNNKLLGKKVTLLVGSGGGYSAGTAHPEWNFATPYLKHIFTVLGSTDVEAIHAEFTGAGKRPGMEALVAKKDKSWADCIAAAEARAAI